MFTGDTSAVQVAEKQPMKLAAMEGLYSGKNGVGLIALGVLNPAKKEYNDTIKPFLFKISAPKMLSYLAYRDANAFVPGVKDILDGNYVIINEKGQQTKPITTDEKITFGKMAHKSLIDYRLARKEKNDSLATVNKAIFEATSPYFGYGYVKDKKQLIPNISLTFYAFRFMVIFGMFFLCYFIFLLIVRRRLEHMKWLQWVALIAIPLAYLTSFSGWIVAEVGRQPWAIQDLLPTFAAVSKVPVGSIQTTLTIFCVILGTLTIAMVSIMVREIRKGPENIK
jgi:cytochrome d ubiquinol oxidase subunit I